ncbi:MAG TPA: MEDS domain-containing protein [Nitrososphaera sp.]|nr:MEDS domain-containing protein [Nitrososphaera sp.]
MLVYPDLDSFQEIYCGYAKKHLEPPHNEIVLIVTHYQDIGKVRRNLLAAGVDVSKYEKKEGSLIILDSVQSYHANSDHTGVLKLAESLVEKAEREGRTGVCVFGDIGSFFLFDRVPELLQYELSIPKRLPIKLKSFCSYHADDYGKLSNEEKKILVDNHFRRIQPLN